jgi:hypothetical protein
MFVAELSVNSLQAWVLSKSKKPTVEEFERCCRLVVVAEACCNLVMTPANVPRSTQVVWLQEASAGVHASELEALCTSSLPEDTPSGGCAPFVLEIVPSLKLLQTKSRSQQALLPSDALANMHSEDLIREREQYLSRLSQDLHNYAFWVPTFEEDHAKWDKLQKVYNRNRTAHAKTACVEYLFAKNKGMFALHCVKSVSDLTTSAPSAIDKALESLRETAGIKREVLALGRLVYVCVPLPPACVRHLHTFSLMVITVGNPMS